MAQFVRKRDKKKILAIDDAAIMLQRISGILESTYDVITVNSGERALRYLANDKPDLILLDIRMKPKDGFQTLREIREMEDRADIPVIMLTGLEDKRSVIEGAKMGIADYVLKPFAADDLRERIARAMENAAEIEKAKADAQDKAAAENEQNKEGEQQAGDKKE